MALTSANFNNASLSNLPLSFLTNKNCFQIIGEEMGEEIGTCGLMQEDISGALIKANEKKITKFDESFIVDSVRWFPWQLTWEVIELKEPECSAPTSPTAD